MKIYLECKAFEEHLGIIKARINEGVNKVTMINLDLASRYEIYPKDFDNLIGKPVTVFIEDTIDRQFQKTRLDGLVFELIDVTNGKGDNGVFYYTMAIRPQLWSLNYFAHSRSYPDKSRIQVIDELLQEHNFAKNEGYTTRYVNENIYPTFNQILQTGTSDLSFFKNTLANAGINFYFASDDDAEKPEQLHLVDDYAFFPNYEETVPIVSSGGMMQNSRRVETITKLARAIPGEVNTTSYMGDGSTNTGTSLDTQDHSGVNGKVQVFVPEGGKNIDGAARHAGKVVSEGYVANRVVYKGISDHMRIRPGKRIPFKDYNTAREYKLLMLDVQHYFDQSVLSAISEEHGGEVEYKNYFVAAEPNVNVRPQDSQTDIDIDLSVDGQLNLDMEGKLSVNPKFTFSPKFSFNPTFKAEVNTHGIGVLMATVAALQAQILSLKSKIDSLESRECGTAGGSGLISAEVVESAKVSAGNELTCKVVCEEFPEPIVALVSTSWHAPGGGSHFLPRKGNHVWIQKIRRANDNEWVVVGYRPTSKVAATNNPVRDTMVKALKTESAPTWETSTSSIIADDPCNVSNYNRLGFMGEGNVAELFVADGDSASIVARAQKNIYIQADKDVQMSSKKHLHIATDSSWQEYGELHRAVLGNKLEFIDGAHEMTILEEQNISVGGKQTIHVIEDQEVTVDNGQKITVTNGKREVNVLKGNLETTVTDGSLIENVNGDETRRVTGKKELLIGADLLNTIIGDCTYVKASTERGLTISDKELVNIAAELSLNLGASQKVNIGAISEQTYAARYTYTGGPKRERATIAECKADAVWAFNATLHEVKSKMSTLKSKVQNIDSVLTIFRG